MANAIPPKEPALTGGMIDMPLEEEIMPTPALPPQEEGFDYGTPTGDRTASALPPITPTAEGRREQLMERFQEDLKTMEVQIDEALGGNPYDINPDEGLFGFMPDDPDKPNSPGVWRYKDEIYAKALGYVPFKPGLLTSAEKQAVEGYANQIKEQKLTEKKIKIQLKEKQITRFVNFFKDMLKGEREKAEIERVQAQRRKVADLKAKRETRLKEAAEKKGKRDIKTEKRAEERLDLSKRAAIRADAIAKRPEMTRTKALGEIARARRSIAQFEKTGKTDPLSAELFGVAAGEKVDPKTKKEMISAFNEYIDHLKTFTTKQKETELSKKLKKTRISKKNAIKQLEDHNKVVNAKNIRKVMESY